MKEIYALPNLANLVGVGTGLKKCLLGFIDRNVDYVAFYDPKMGVVL